MSEFVKGTEGEILDFYGNNEYKFIKSIVTTITEGTFVKLPTQTFIFSDFSAIDITEPYPRPQNVGYLSNNTMQQLEFTYEV
jgi:hypothetical protein